MKIIILIPVYNDYKSVFKLIEEINLNVSNLEDKFSIILIDDASIDVPAVFSPKIDNVEAFKIVKMKKNMGHARCIATGLKHIFENENFDYVIPMDGDGEDRPEEIKDFIEHINYSPNTPIVGERVKRSENFIFKFCYEVHKILTFIFSGKLIKFGNFSCIPKSTVEKMINEKATWSSFSGALTKVEKSKSSTPSIRGNRYFGPSKMSFYNLLKHSFAIIAVFKATVIIRCIIFYAVYLMLIAKNISYITSIPLVLIVIFAISILKISGRENIDEFNNSLTNIQNIENLK